MRLTSTPFSTIQPNSAITDKDSIDDGCTQLTEKINEARSELEHRWLCEEHSKGKEAYCYKAPGTTLCYELSIYNLRYWASEMVSSASLQLSYMIDAPFQIKKRATLDEKPASLVLSRARPRGRSASYSLHEGLPTVGTGIGMQQPIIIYPGMLQDIMKSSQSASASAAITAPPQAVPSSQIANSVMGQPTSSTGASPDAASIDIIAWFEMLDHHPQRNKDGILYSKYGPLLKEMDFYRISQLTTGDVTKNDLQEWLGVKVGTAVLILTYAKEDMAKFNSGQSLLP